MTARPLSGPRTPLTVTRDSGGKITALSAPGVTIDTIVRDGNGLIASYHENGIARTVTRDDAGNVTSIT